MTPLLMRCWPPSMVPIHFVDMMLSIRNMIIVPILAGPIANRILYSRAALGQVQRDTGDDCGCGDRGGGAGHCLPWAVAGFGWGAEAGDDPRSGFDRCGCRDEAGGQRGAWSPGNWMDRVCRSFRWPASALSSRLSPRDRARNYCRWSLLIAASILHNFVGYLFGYWCARLLRDWTNELAGR